MAFGAIPATHANIVIPAEKGNFEHRTPDTAGHVALSNPPREIDEDVNLLRLLGGQLVPRGGPQVVQRVV
jgi:hypothetical protein